MPTDEQIKRAVAVLQSALAKHSAFYRAFLASIQSAVSENRDRPDDELAENILKRIIGEK